MVRDIIKGGTTADWQAKLSAAGLQNEAVQSYPEFIAHEQTKALDVIAWLPQAGSDEPWPVPNIPGFAKFKPGTALAVSPTKGQHTRELLAEYGYDERAIAKLVADGVAT